ncbi:hypothetical protein TNCV_145551 [Trichonephila clavipes]|nr:hypothetical protein TNCV_145551 [Trichonephila clavipes]
MICVPTKVPSDPLTITIATSVVTSSDIGLRPLPRRIVNACFFELHFFQSIKRQSPFMWLLCSKLMRAVDDIQRLPIIRILAMLVSYSLELAHFS